VACGSGKQKLPERIRKKDKCGTGRKDAYNRGNQVMIKTYTGQTKCIIERCERKKRDKPQNENNLPSVLLCHVLKLFVFASAKQSACPLMGYVTGEQEGNG